MYQMGGVMTALSDSEDFEVIRIKNRLDMDHRAVETAGYASLVIRAYCCAMAIIRLCVLDRRYAGTAYKRS